MCRRPAQILSVLHTELFRRDVLVFPESFDHMAAVGKPGGLADVGHVVIREKQHVLRLDHADILDVLLARASVDLAELLGKEGVAHITAHGELLDLKRLVRVRVDVLRDGLYGAARRRGDLVGGRESALPPDAQHIDQDTVDIGIYDHVVPVMPGMCLPRAAAEKFQDRKTRQFLRGEEKGDIRLLHRLQYGAFELGHIPNIFAEAVQVEFDHIIQQVLLCAGLVVDGMNALWRQGSHIAGAQQVRFLNALNQGSSLDHQDNFHIVMPVRPHWKSVFCRIKQESLIGGVQQVPRLKQVVHGADTSR